MHPQVQPQGSMHPGSLDALYQAQAPPSADNALSYAPQVADAALGYVPPESFRGLAVRGVPQAHLPPPMHQAPPQVLGHLGAYGGGFGGEQPAPPLLAVQRSTSAEGSEGPGGSGGRMPHTPRPSSEAAQTLVAAHLLNGDVVQLLLPQSMVSDAAQAQADAQNALGPYLQQQPGLGTGLAPSHSGSHAGMLAPLGPAGMLASVLEAHGGLGLGLPPSAAGGQGLVDPGTSTAVGMDGRSV
ncbi:hypothetical protein H632_c83p4 [Helicosporidium sp. ATCC 50920]|nr:hypothetical protein H632_c83p4 [Helicosporidium sp. ATCC 50920]|eukprot:KDD76867.1 hypothetical protein H632_c83p4 [Helicosporidium sp. ATCC 50920]